MAISGAGVPRSEGPFERHEIRKTEPAAITAVMLKTLTSTSHSAIERESSSLVGAPVYLLVGTSTAGKSSIIQVLCQDPQWVEMGIDLAFFAAIANLIKEVMPEAYDRLAKAVSHKDMADALITNTVRFKESLSPEIQREALTALEAIKKRKEEILSRFDPAGSEVTMYNEVIEAALKGQNVVFDHWAAEPFLKHAREAGFAAPVRVSLAYCPFDVLLMRVKERNRLALTAGNEANWRPLTNPLKHFTDLYGPAEVGDPVLEHITRRQAEEAIDTAFAETLDYFSTRDPKEYSEIKNREIQDRKQILEKLGFSHPDITSVAIAPRFKQYQKIFNTAIMSPESSAEALRTW